MIILGVSGLYHDSAATIIDENKIIAAAQEERFTRIKHDNRLPVNAIRYCLKEAGVSPMDLDAVVYYDKPMLTLDRYIKNIIALGEEADYLIDSKLDDVVINRLSVDRNLRKVLGVLGKEDKLYTVEHHMSHAASAFYPSPYKSSAIITVDGVGEWATTTIGRGVDDKIEIIKQIDYPHSLGLVYSAFSSFCGFKVNSGEYKFMGLAPYGEPVFYDLIKEEIIDIKEDGSFRLNLDYFDYYKGKYMTNQKFSDLFGGPAREMESRITKREMDIAASAQKVIEEIIILLGRYAKKITGEKNLCMAGGVALNCVANGKLLSERVFENIWIQPASDDSGGALGCALYTMYEKFNVARSIDENDSQRGSYLGPDFDDDYIESYIKENSCVAVRYESEDDLCNTVAGYIDEGRVIGWFQGRMEYGPRALGNRSILGDPRNAEMQSKMNLKIKHRESFRPFAPIVLRERVNDYFVMEEESPYMLLVSEVQPDRRTDFKKQDTDDMLEIVNRKRSDIPAITHVDYSARIQTVTGERNPLIYKLTKSFEKLTGCGVLINTSFNVRGEPIVCTPEDAYRCFMRTEMDVLVLGHFVLLKDKQPAYEEIGDMEGLYELD